MNIDQALTTAQELIAKATCPVSFSGAGLSAESGIATFRGDDDSMWSRFDPSQLASEQGFYADKQLVMDWYADRRKTLATAKPNLAHTALAEQPDWIHVTQNVDNLLEAAGAAPTEVLHLHGSLLYDHCHSRCGYQELIDLNNPPTVRTCPTCNGDMRPSVVWFGESLPEEAWARATNAIEQCDLLLVVGTSAQVYPAAGLIDLARRNRASIIVVDLDSDRNSNANEVYLQGRAAEILPQLIA